jgi:hypothetical protein
MPLRLHLHDKRYYNMERVDTLLCWGVMLMVFKLSNWDLALFVSFRFNSFRIDRSIAEKELHRRWRLSFRCLRPCVPWT